MGEYVGGYCDAPGKLFNQGLFEESSEKKHRLGTIRILDDGRVYAYALAGTALYAGLLTEGAAADTLAVEKAVAVQAEVGDAHVHITYGAGTTAVANYFADGYLCSAKVAVYPGPMYKIRSHIAAVSGATLDVHLYDKIREILTTSCYVSMIRNPQAGVILHTDAAPLSFLTGVPPIDVTNAYYFWNQVKGMCSLALAGTELPGVVCVGSATAGSVMPLATVGTQAPCGVFTMEGVTDTWHTFVMLSIPGY